MSRTERADILPHFCLCPHVCTQPWAVVAFYQILLGVWLPTAQRSVMLRCNLCARLLPDIVLATTSCHLASCTTSNGLLGGLWYWKPMVVALCLVSSWMGAVGGGGPGWDLVGAIISAQTKRIPIGCGKPT